MRGWKKCPKCLGLAPQSEVDSLGWYKCDCGKFFQDDPGDSNNDRNDTSTAEDKVGGKVRETDIIGGYHTPGPWHCVDVSEVELGMAGYAPQVGITDETGTRILAVLDQTDGQDEANARLIKSAPDLLAMLQIIRGCQGSFSVVDGVVWLESGEDLDLNRLVKNAIGEK